MLSEKKLENNYETTKNNFIRTPVIRLKWLEKLTGSKVYAKLENQQISGSFKYRGACVAMSSLKNKIIAASAGNHGLAIAKAAKYYDHECTIVIPSNASLIKKDRIQFEEIELIEFGQSLWEAEGYAKSLAERTGWSYISPYDNEFVIEGNSTLFLECVEQVNSVQNIFAAVGGGGLLSGLITGKNNAGAKVNIIGAEPVNYTTVKNYISDVKHTNFTTFADGLAVEVDNGSLTLKIIKAEQPLIASVSEKDIAAATYSMLNKESILVEPSAAAALAGFVKLAKMNLVKGDTVIIFSGGNIHKNVLNKILTYDYEGSSLYEFLDLKGREVKNIINSNTIKHTTFQPAKGVLQLEDVLEGLKNKFKYLQRNIKNYVLFCKENCLNVNYEIINHSISEIDFALSGLNNKKRDDFFCNVQELRYLHALYAFHSNAIEWRSPAYNQSLNPEFFNMGYQDSSGVNYERYANASSIELENRLLENLQIPSSKYTLLSASSGMAAFSLIESYLSRFILSSRDKILLAPYIYFEAKEQLCYKYGGDIIISADYTIKTIIDDIKKYKPKVVFADPLANIAEQRLINIPKLISAMRDVIDYPIYLVIDGTMLSGALPKKIFHEANHESNVHILYYESGSKYLQLGMELTLFGLIVIPVALKAQMERLRRNHGSILPAQLADSLPVYHRETYVNRMRELTKLSFQLAEKLSATTHFASCMHIHHPMLTSHPDFSVLDDAGYPFTGSIVCLSFKDNGKNNVNYLKSYVNSIINKAQQLCFPICEGLSFGFTTTRISTASSMSESDLPFMRISVGDLKEGEVNILADIIISGLTHLEYVVDSQ